MTLVLSTPISAQVTQVISASILSPGDPGVSTLTSAQVTQVVSAPT
jgi:hypothetical protein